MNEIVFRKDKIGELDAENDKEFLSNCFIEHDLYTQIQESNSKFILVGRTGAGKTALIDQLANKVYQNTHQNLKIEEIYYEGIENNFHFKQLIEAAVNVRLLYKIFWIDYIIRRLADENLIQDLKPVFDKYRNFEFLKEEFSSKTIQVSSSVGNENLNTSYMGKAGIGVGFNFFGSIRSMLNLDVSSKKEKSNLIQEKEETIKETIRNSATKINTDILKYQKDLIGEVSTIFARSKDKYKNIFFISIDDIDSYYSNGNQKKELLEFIYSLIDAVGELNNFEGIKPLVSIRLDILLSMYDHCKTQREKFLSRCLSLEWDQDDLKKIIVKRINHLFEFKYKKKEEIKLDQVLGFKMNKFGNCKAIDYILERTMGRPRDIIDFLNNCIERLKDSPIDEYALVSAFSYYKSSRIKGLKDEWGTNESNASIYIDLISRFSGNNIANTKYEFTLENLKECSELGDSINHIDKTLAGDNEILMVEGNLEFLLEFWFKVGIVGLYNKERCNIMYSDYSKSTLDVGDFKCKFVIHPLFRN